MATDDLALARHYDALRRPSPSLVTPLRELLDPLPGERLLDAGIGTGNYSLQFAELGMRLTGCDTAAAMLGGAAAKLPGAWLLRGDVRWLPFETHSFDRVLCVNVLDQVDGWELALAEFGRVLERGRLVVALQTSENQQGNWASYYFPEASRRERDRYPDERAVVQALRLLGFARVLTRHVSYTDLDDATLAAMKHWPSSFLDQKVRRSMPFFGRMDPDELDDGLEQLEADYQAGTLWHLVEHFRPYSRRYGDITLVAADST